MKKILSVSVILLFISCQKTITLSLNTVPPQLVIQGEITDSAGPYTIMINRSVNFYADNNFPAVSGASVRISDNDGVTDTLIETNPGIYATHNIQGKPGFTYTLSVNINDTMYTATSMMPQPVPLDSITFNHSLVSSRNGITVQANYQDPGGISNYYQFVLYINGSQFTKNYYAFDDRLKDGKYVVQNLFMDSAYLKTGDNLKVNMYCIEVNVFNYFNQLSQASNTGAFNTTVAPANPSTNISNGAYGIFSAHTVSSRSKYIQ
jgi:hypothetical protein